MKITTKANEQTIKGMAFIELTSPHDVVGIQYGFEPNPTEADNYGLSKYHRMVSVSVSGDTIHIVVKSTIDGHGLPTKKGPKVKITTDTALPVEINL